MSLALPRLLVGGYQLNSRIGEGGLATVYRGTDIPLGRSVAVKVLKEQHAQNQGFVARFEREARAAARIRHPNVVEVLDSGQEDGTLFIVMELVEGRDLKVLIHERAPSPVLTEEALIVIESVL